MITTRKFLNKVYYYYEGKRVAKATFKRNRKKGRLEVSYKIEVCGLEIKEEIEKMIKEEYHKREKNSYK